MKTNVVVTLQIEGVHQWKNAPDEVGFLRNLHRHIFHIKCVKSVKHDDRDIEIIMLKREITQYLLMQYKGIYQNDCLFFGEMSCEMIAKDLMKTYNLEQCEVLEDGENGALLIK